MPEAAEVGTTGVGGAAVGAAVGAAKVAARATAIGAGAASCSGSTIGRGSRARPGVAIPIGPTAGAGIFDPAFALCRGAGVIVETEAGFAGLLIGTVFAGCRDWTFWGDADAAAGVAAGAETGRTGVGGCTAFVTGAAASGVAATVTGDVADLVTGSATGTTGTATLNTGIAGAATGAAVATAATGIAGAGRTVGAAGADVAPIGATGAALEDGGAALGAGTAALRAGGVALLESSGTRVNSATAAGSTWESLTEPMRRPALKSSSGSINSAWAASKDARAASKAGWDCSAGAECTVGALCITAGSGPRSSSGSMSSSLSRATGAGLGVEPAASAGAGARALWPGDSGSAPSTGSSIGSSVRGSSIGSDAASIDSSLAASFERTTTHDAVCPAGSAISTGTPPAIPDGKIRSHSFPADPKLRVRLTRCPILQRPCPATCAMAHRSESRAGHRDQGLNHRPLRLQSPRYLQSSDATLAAHRDGSAGLGRNCAFIGTAFACAQRSHQSCSPRTCVTLWPGRVR